MLGLADKGRYFTDPDLKEGKVKSHYSVDLIRKRGLFLLYLYEVNSLNCAKL